MSEGSPGDPGHMMHDAELGSCITVLGGKLGLGILCWNRLFPKVLQEDQPDQENHPEPNVAKTLR